MKRGTIKLAVFAASCLIAVTMSAQASDSVDVLQAFQNTCSQLLAVPPTAASLKCLSTYAKEVQDADLKAAVLATYAMGLICCDQAQDAYKIVQHLKQDYPMTPHLVLFQGSQYLADCPKCSGSGTAEGRCSQCGGRGTCKGCGGRGTTMEFNQAGATCKACQGSRQYPACQGSRRETVKCPLCFGKRQIASKELMKSAYVKLIQQTQALALEHEREAKGLILFEGQWVTPADKQKELDKRNALAKAKQAEEDQKLAGEKQMQEKEEQKLAEAQPMQMPTQKQEVTTATDKHGKISVGYSSPVIVTTLAGDPGVYSVDRCRRVDGRGSEARFISPTSVAVDRKGNVYVVDYTPDMVIGYIRKITPDGMVSTFAKCTKHNTSGTAVDSRGNVIWIAGDQTAISPGGLATDDNGNVYVAEGGNYVIRKIAPEGMMTTYAGVLGYSGSTDGPGTEARFASPNEVAVDGRGYVYVSDGTTIRKISPGGLSVSTLAGSSADGRPIIKFDAQMHMVITPGGSPGSGRVDGKGGMARFRQPFGVAVDGSGCVYVADGDTFCGCAIRKITPDGMVTTFVGSIINNGLAYSDDTGLDWSYIRGLATDDTGNVYVADTGNSIICKITPGGEVSIVAGSRKAAGISDGVGTAARFRQPFGVAVDRNGTIYVADTGNHAIRKITPAATATP